MAGIVFLKSRNLNKLRDFYQSVIGCELWLEQEDCVIFRSHNFLFGFCQRDTVDTAGMLTFFYESRGEVDRMHRLLESESVTSPKVNPKYDIYHFFASDPEGRTLEFQYFAEPVARYMAGDSLLLSRRSVREFTERVVSDGLLRTILDISRFAPTSRNSQSYYFRIVRNRKDIEFLSKVRGESTRPIGNAGMAVAICSDPAASMRYDQDACIATYHFMLAAWFHGLGTCWIGGMDRNDVKERLSIPKEHYLATVTPLGYPSERVTPVTERKNVEEFIRE